MAYICHAFVTTTRSNFGHCLFFCAFIGVWDVMSNVEVIDFVRQRIAEKMNPGEVRNEGAFFHSAYGL